jgi:Uncharacterized conserved protein (DUF2183)
MPHKNHRQPWPNVAAAGYSFSMKPTFKVLLAAMMLLLIVRTALPQPRAAQTIVDDGWSTQAGYRLSGRLTEDDHAPARADSGRFDTLYRSTRLLFASGSEGTVGLAVGELRWQLRADDQGYFSLFHNQPLALAPGWHAISADPAASSEAQLLVPDPRNRFGIISDIDDTILVSGVNQKLKLVSRTLLLPPEARNAVPGMAARYRQWTQRNAAPALTPVFYVSASPKQLSDSIQRFLRSNDFPPGVLLLKQVGPESDDPLRDQQRYKVERIRAVLAAFPQVRFVLVGDDGERDPESFAALQALFPDQIEAIYIRRVHPDPKRERIDGQLALPDASAG